MGEVLKEVVKEERILGELDGMNKHAKVENQGSA